jgi:hypothetical protein
LGVGHSIVIWGSLGLGVTAASTCVDGVILVLILILILIFACSGRFIQGTDRGTEVVEMIAVVRYLLAV